MLFILAVSNRFDKDEHNHLLKHFFHTKQTATVSESVEPKVGAQCHLTAQQILKAVELRSCSAVPLRIPSMSLNCSTDSVITNRFVDGLSGSHPRPPSSAPIINTFD